jgi:hypothetical protein
MPEVVAVLQEQVQEAAMAVLGDLVVVAQVDRFLHKGRRVHQIPVVAVVAIGMAKEPTTVGLG